MKKQLYIKLFFLGLQEKFNLAINFFEISISSLIEFSL